MSKTAILAVRIVGDGKGGQKALSDVADGAASMQKTLDVASGASAVALGAIGVAAKAAGDAASEAQQAAGGVDAVFGQYAERVTKYAEAASQAVGLSKTDYSNLATIIGSQLKNMGHDMDQATGKTSDLITMGADLAATYGGTTADAVSALSSLLRGERDPIERYGVSINQAAVDAEKAALGLTGLTGEAEKNANLQATLSLLTRQTADAQGQFGRESDTAAGAQARANAEWQNSIAALGEQLLPLMTEGATILAEFAMWVGENTELVTVIVAVIGFLAGAILLVNGALKAYQAVQVIATAATWASNAAWLANPITWIVLLIAALIAAIVLLVMNWDDVSKKAGEVWGGVSDWIKGVIDWFKKLYDWSNRISAAIGGVFQGKGFGAVRDAFSSGLNVQSRMVTDASAPVANARMASFSTMAASTSAASSTSSLVSGGFIPTATGRTGDTFNIDVTAGMGADGTAIGKQIVTALRDYQRDTGRRTAGGDLK